MKTANERYRPRCPGGMSGDPSLVRKSEALANLRDMRRFRVAPSKARPKKVFLDCHYCGYSPPNGLPKGGACPKCGGMSWERFALARPLVPPHML
jgi:hypothetical protein